MNAGLPASLLGLAAIGGLNFSVSFALAYLSATLSAGPARLACPAPA
jgi:hypothetical protein